MVTNYENTIRNLLSQGNTLEIINYFKMKSVLRSKLDCYYCNQEMVWVQKKSSIDQYAWKCQNKVCRKYKTTSSIRSYSLFSLSNISLQTWLDLLYRWSNEEQISMVQKSLTISTPVIIKIFQKLRSCVSLYWERNPLRLGGDQVICQIDESLFVPKQKYHRGRVASEQIWVFGIVDTSYTPARGVMIVVPNRRAETLKPLITRYVRPGSIIHSDEWRAYSNLQSLGYKHDTVNHSLNFVSPQTGVHTQNVESYWSKNKLRVKKMKGIQRIYLQDYLYEFMWRDNLPGDPFEKLIDLVKNYFLF